MFKNSCGFSQIAITKILEVMYWVAKYYKSYAGRQIKRRQERPRKTE